LALDSLQLLYKFPGAIAVYVLPDGTTVIVASGNADIEKGILMKPDCRMLAASIGKTFVDALAVALDDEGKTDLDLPISNCIEDENWFYRFPNHEDLTIRHLLTHKSGLPGHVYMPEFACKLAHRRHKKNNPFTAPDLTGFILDKKPLFDTGEGWSY